ncbi:hypothetical protein EAF00_001581 [Botryotinia globosa]|nr:hypothetical protein EAF00_001581 [Botryotinia globosa]
MKLVVAGSTGFVATELIKQALSSPEITSIIALARRETSVPQTLDVMLTSPNSKHSFVRISQIIRRVCRRNLRALMRVFGIFGEAESRVIDFAQASNGTVEACIAKPGLIDVPDRRQGLVGSVLSTIGRSLIGLPKVDVSQIAATLLEQLVKGIEKETLSNEDLIRIGNKELSG